MTRPRLALEPLEAREVPTVFGNPWQQAQNLTLSFAPDGVAYSNQMWSQTAYTSRLFADLNGTMATAVWQEALLRAVDTWTAAANVNVGLVADPGTAFGPAGLSPATRPPTFRVGAASNGTDVLAMSVPNHPLTGGFAGTLMLNDAYTFTQGGGNGTYDLYSVALHEFGNLLGLPDSGTVGSTMYGSYFVRAGLTATDVTAVQAMYGARPADAFEGTGGNNTLTTASALAAVTDPAAFGRTRVVADGNVTAAGDVDHYRFTLPAGQTSLTVRLGTAGKSLLAGRVEVFNGAGQLIGSRTNTSPLQGDTVLTLTGLAAGQEYTVRVSAGRTDAFRTGTYQLRVGFGYDPVTETVADPVQRFGIDNGTNNTRQTATALTTSPGFAPNARFEWSGRVESVSDSDFYRFVAPSTGGTMTLTVLSKDGLSASATVFNAAGQVVNSDIILNWEGGMYRAQVPNAVAGATYFVQLKVQDANYSAWSGDYLASVDFTQPRATTQALTSGTATQGGDALVGIDVQESGAFRFRLGATSTNTAVANWIDAYIFDATGALVAMWGTDGLASNDTLVAFLAKGRYTVLFRSYFVAPAATLSYTLGATRLSDPIDPLPPPDPINPPPPVSPPPVQSSGDLAIRIIVPPLIPWLP